MITSRLVHGSECFAAGIVLRCRGRSNTPLV
jgi:hypothetical protein